MKKTKIIREKKMRKDIIDYLIDFPLFDALKGNQLNIVAAHMNYYEINKSVILFKEGDKGNYICFVLDGVIDVLKKSVTGDSVVIAALPKGRSFGEMSIIDNFPRSATAKARTKSSFLTLAGEFWVKRCQEDYLQYGITILKEEILKGH
ncbi:MAG: CRP/FNR family transcriptional regulator, cyclic AMP receptor protein [Desulfobacteraceae bacterium Eth-SRB2]|nr:MAG: CRP/FNR family transcriptional regulator, cyclic AMP receptor protein [Desulfobacteraceae bacterium Eth-SRB2]